MAVSVVVAYDGSPEASAAIEAGALLFPAAHGWVTHLWAPPFASGALHRRLRARAGTVEQLVALVEAEGRREAQRLVDIGVTLARAAGWQAEALLKKCWGGEGLRIAEIAEQQHADVVLVGARGLDGARAVAGSVSDTVVHYCSRPVVVIAFPLLAREHAALRDGPVLVGWDGSPGARTALEAAAGLFPQRKLLAACVEEDDAASPTPHGCELVRLDSAAGAGGRARGVAEALIAAASDHDAAVVVVGSRGRSAALQILLGSVAMATAHHCPRPVMVVPSRWQSPPPR
ncbi:universal stress protein [Nocardia farcinica]|uniref:universal stress protein n=2 Tax=Bacillati TaxID=1783272 RepID=UPI001895696A|nr:universal stress protein [Nocardia farcinica]MBF6234838.1 universal stress protein [Nocardia farcinica]MBF6257214.1 universal stress protein [Nocardia farcinica]MBF6265543.1 universal stress protein [Nocardia farcinica]MBF6271286.1 universal stress protein [Nocardia farcinica]MBF6422749.1 universal stress protein [Nocardia farcinica]